MMFCRFTSRISRPSHINELKSKPTQLSVRTLNSMGIQPDFIVGRAELPIDENAKKSGLYCNLSTDEVISNPDCDSIYEVPPRFCRTKVWWKKY